MHIPATGIACVANDNPAMARRDGRFDPEPIDPEALAFAERGAVDEDDVRGIAFPALLEVAQSVPPIGIGPRLRPRLATDGGKARSAVQAQVAEIVTLAVDREAQRLARDLPAAPVETDQ